MIKIYCSQCHKNIIDLDKATYIRQTGDFVCSLDCFTNYAYEYLNCASVDKNLIFKMKGVLNLE